MGKTELPWELTPRTGKRGAGGGAWAGQGRLGGLAAAAAAEGRGCIKEEFVLRDESSRSCATLAFVVTGVGAWWGLEEGTQVPLVSP